MTQYQTILVEKHGAVTLIRLNRPEALNALNSQVLTDLIDAFATYEADDTSFVLIKYGQST
jgi:enoyl-CoA hydratase